MSKSMIVDPRFILSAITMEQVLQHYGILERFKQTGIHLAGPCPLHKGKSSTEFRVNIARKTWVCFGECRHGGDVLDFIAIMENVTHEAATTKAVDWFKLDQNSPIAPVKCCA